MINLSKKYLLFFALIIVIILGLVFFVYKKYETIKNINQDPTKPISISQIFSNKYVGVSILSEDPDFQKAQYLYKTGEVEKGLNFLYSIRNNYPLGTIERNSLDASISSYLYQNNQTENFINFSFDILNGSSSSLYRGTTKEFLIAHLIASVRLINSTTTSDIFYYKIAQYFDNNKIERPSPNLKRNYLIKFSEEGEKMLSTPFGSANLANLYINAIEATSTDVNTKAIYATKIKTLLDNIDEYIKNIDPAILKLVSGDQSAAYLISAQVYYKLSFYENSLTKDKKVDHSTQIKSFYEKSLALSEDRSIYFYYAGYLSKLPNKDNEKINMLVGKMIATQKGSKNFLPTLLSAYKVKKGIVYDFSSSIAENNADYKNYLNTILKANNINYEKVK